MTLYDGAWFAARLSVVENRGNPPHDFFTDCPSCGSVDNFHVGPRTDPDGNVKAKCFGCGITQGQAVSLLEGEGEVTVSPSITRSRQRRPAEPEEPRDRRAEADPLGWWAEHCRVPRSFLDSLPLAAEGGSLAFTFDDMTVVKTRRAGTKKPLWVPEGAANPPLWPIPPREMPDTMLLVEGEADATVMAFHVGLSSLDRMISVHSVTKGAAAPVPVNVWRDLGRRGLRSVLVLFDEDRPGEAGAQENVANALEAVLTARRVHLDGVDLLRGEKDARDVWLRRVASDPESTVNLDLAEPSLSDMGARVLSEVDAALSPPLIHGILDPEGHTILYGQGDSGKGVIASAIIADITREGRRVLVADFEGHPNEWRRRVAGHGGVVENVVIVEPTGPIWDVADDLADVGREFGAEFVVVDSISVAAAGDKDPYSPNVPPRYGAALRRVGLVALSLAHITKTDDLRYPFGSIHWHNQARTTWSLDASTEPRVLEHRKKGNRPWQGKYEVEITFDDDAGVIRTSIVEMAGASPTVRRPSAAQRADETVARVVEALARVAPTASEAATKTAVHAETRGNKAAVLRAVDEALRRGVIGVTSMGTYYSLSSAVPDGSGTDPEPVPHHQTGEEPRSTSVRSGSGSGGSAPREPEPEPSRGEEEEG